jgi:transcriptional regulator with GAF, ATPase, and Fis domain
MAILAEALQSIALKVAEARSLQTVLASIVHGLTAQPEVALARLWLIAPGDVCATCRMRPECSDQTRCLHLAASAGRPTRDGSADWSRLDGDFRRFPLSVRKIGHIGATGQPILIPEVAQESAWIARPAWAAQEGIRAFAGQPLVFRGTIRGVLGVFSRAEITPAEFAWLRTFADHASVAIANAEAFEEVTRLRRQLELERDYLREEAKAAGSYGDIVGLSPALEAVLRRIELVAPTDTSVLILGESGTGKELVATALHERSRRRTRPLVRINCASVPRELFESEFFGHVKGAFTGALRDRVGRFQLADGGTLFLDEVGEIPLELQGKLLRVLQDGQFEAVGDDTTRRVDVRVIAATNRALKGEVEAGRFSQDLYYRLSVFPVELPPLRERRQDIGLLAAHFLRLSRSRLNRPEVKLTGADVQVLEAYDWPGNIRELQNVIERAVILSSNGRLHLDVGSRSGAPPVWPPPPERRRPALTETELRRHEHDNMLAALEAAHGKIYGAGGAAEMLGIKPTTLASRMKAMGITRRH